MNANLKEIWSDMKDEIQKNWDALTDEDIKAIDGDMDKLLDKLQLLYGYSYKKAQLEWLKFCSQFSDTVNCIDEAASASAHYIGDSIQSFVKSSPVKALGIAAAAGLILGLRFRL